MKNFDVHPVCEYPPACDRKAWEAVGKKPLLQEFCSRIFIEADKTLHAEMPCPSASQFMDFFRNGNRSVYENFYFQRRSDLQYLVLAECFEYKGRYLDRIVDYIWEILNEPTWCIPAHVGMGVGDVDVLPDLKAETVDLFSSETSMALSRTLMLLEKELKDISPVLVQRMRRTIYARAVEPFNRNISFWWQGGGNNWSIWCAANLLAAAFVVLEGEEFRKYTAMLMDIAEKYIDIFMEDGACDEGATYWTVSPAMLLRFLEGIYLASDGRISFYDDPKVKKMGDFIADMWIGGDFFVSFADSSVKIRPSCGMLLRYAERTGSSKLRDFALKFHSSCPLQPNIIRSQAFCCLNDIFWTPDSLPDLREIPDNTAWYDKYQALMVRRGRLFMAVKGGNNDERHNHNDVGQFIIAVDGRPVVVDPGKSEYTRFTFSDRRYENFILNSFGHNVFSFNGIGQKEGAASKAEAVEFSTTPEKTSLAMELVKCYPDVEGLKSYTRKVEFDGINRVVMEDSWQSDKPLVPVLPLYISAPWQDGVIGGVLKLDSDLPAEYLPVECSDPDLRNTWGDDLRKLQYTLPAACSGVLRLEFTLQENN